MALATSKLSTRLAEPLLKVACSVQKAQDLNFGPVNLVDQTVALHEKLASVWTSHFWHPSSSLTQRC